MEYDRLRYHYIGNLQIIKSNKRQNQDKSTMNKYYSVCNDVIKDRVMHNSRQSAIGHNVLPIGASSGGRFVVLQRLMDREALVLLFDGSEKFI